MTQIEIAWPKGIYAITLFVDDLVITKQFYQKVFGLSVVFEDDNSCVFKIGETLINLLKTTSADELIGPAKVASRDDWISVCVHHRRG